MTEGWAGCLPWSEDWVGLATFVGTQCDADLTFVAAEFVEVVEEAVEVEVHAVPFRAAFVVAAAAVEAFQVC